MDNRHTPYYTACLSLIGKRCVVIGGGRVAERKIRMLIESKAEIIVISPEFGLQIEQWAQSGCIRILPREYMDGDIKDAFLVFAATNYRDVNQRIYEEASRLGKLVNVVDNPEQCTFIVPATFKQNNLQIAISTSGHNPARAKRMKEQLECDIQNQTRNFIDEIANGKERG